VKQGNKWFDALGFGSSLFEFLFNENKINPFHESLLGANGS
jgi:hypothetical protein